MKNYYEATFSVDKDDLRPLARRSLNRAIQNNQKSWRNRNSTGRPLNILYAPGRQRASEIKIIDIIFIT